MAYSVEAPRAQPRHCHPSTLRLSMVVIERVQRAVTCHLRRSCGRLRAGVNLASPLRAPDAFNAVVSGAKRPCENGPL